MANEIPFNPILSHMPEEVEMRPVLLAMGFEIQFDELFSYDSEEVRELIARYEEGDDAYIEVLQKWVPVPPTEEGYELLGKWDSEDGPIALFVKPVSEWAKRVLALSKEYMAESGENNA